MKRESWCCEHCTFLHLSVLYATRITAKDKDKHTPSLPISPTYRGNRGHDLGMVSTRQREAFDQ